jgi:hypothetical protein
MRDKESTIPMFKYTSQCGEHKAYLDWSGLVWTESESSLMRGVEKALFIPQERVERDREKGTAFFSE